MNSRASNNERAGAVASPDIPQALRDAARDVRRIGDGYRTNPEAIAIAKDEIANRLVRLAEHLARAGWGLRG